MATDGDGDTATGSLSINVDDDMPIANPVAKSLTETGGGNTNVLLVLDVSGSMGDQSGLTGLDRLDVMKAAVFELLELYDAVGEVRVQIAVFSSNATVASSTWMTVAQAKAYVLQLTEGGATDYDAAIAAAQQAFGTPGKIDGAQNVLYFLSDGEPTEGGGISPGEEAGWTSFVNSNDINAYAYGMGGGVSPSALNPLAYDGRGAGTNRDAEVITDLDQLDVVLAGSVIQPASGNILTEGSPASSFGADGGHVQSITYGTQTFLWNPATNTISVVGSGSATASINADHVLTIVTPAQGTLAIDLDNGNYTFTPPAQITSSQVAQFSFELTDRDGDVASNTLGFVLSNFDLPPVVRDDRVLTNVNGDGASIVIPTFALLYNDGDPDGQAVFVTAVGPADSGTVTLANGNVTFVDGSTSDNGGSFAYEGSTVLPAATDPGFVLVNRDQENQQLLDGTGLDDILIGRNVDDILIGYEGKDVLIANGGDDVLVGGPDDDLLVGGEGSDQFRLRSNTGADRVSDYADNVDKIAFLDTGNNNNGSVNFGNTNGNSAGNTLNANDFDERTSITNIQAADDQQVVRINAAQTTDQITGGIGGNGSNLYVFVFNSTTQRGEIWFDTNWSDVGSRVKIATFDNITTLAQLNAITASDIVVTNNAQGFSTPAPPPSSEVPGDPPLPPDPTATTPAETTAADSSIASMLTADGQAEPSSLVASGVATSALESTSSSDSGAVPDSGQTGGVDPSLANAVGASDAGEPSSPAANGMTGIAATTALGIDCRRGFERPARQRPNRRRRPLDAFGSRSKRLSR